MNPSPDESAAGTFDDALAEYLRLSESGARFDRNAWLHKYPQWADELREFIASYGKMESFAGEMRRRRSSAASVTPLGTEVKYVGEYELLEELGQGGMGIVFKARQASLDRLVALKMLLDDSRDRERFRAEAEAAASLDHPNLVTIYEVGEHENWPYYTMQFVDGHDLRETVERGSMPPKRIAELIARLASAVQYAHDRGVLHRDLKPANVLIDKLGEPHITDFGLAKFVADVTRLTQTQTGVVLGTPSYMAPEQAAGDTTQVTVGTDVYGLGSILYALLTGQAPFAGDNSLAVLRQVERDPPVAPRSIRGNVPVDLETICLKCLEKIPRDRYRSAEALAEDLHRFVSGEPILARPIGTIERSWRWCLRNPAVSALAAMLLLMLVGSAVGGIWMARNERRAYEAAEASRALEVAAREDVEESLVDAFIAHGRSAMHRNNPPAVQLWNATAADIARNAEQREMCNARIATRRHRAGLPVRARIFEGGIVKQLDFHPDSRYLLIGDKTDTVMCWDLLRDAPWPALGLQTIITAGWSADGTHLVTGDVDGDVAVVELKTGQRTLLGKVNGAIVSLASDGDASHVIACTAREAALFLHPSNQAKPPQTKPAPSRQWEPPEGEIVHAAIDAAGENIVIQTDSDLAYTFKTAAWPQRSFEALDHEFQQHSADRPHPVRPQLVDGRLVSYARKRIRVTDLATGEPVDEFIIGDSRLLLVDGKRKRLLNGGDRRARLWQLDGSDSSSAFNHRGFVVAGDMCPTRDEVALGSWDRWVVVWIAHDSRRAHFISHQGHPSCVRFSPTGNLLATAQDDGLVRIWRLKKDNKTYRSILVPEGGSRAALSDDGLVFTAGAATKSSIDQLQVVDLDTHQRLGPKVLLGGTLVDTVCRAQDVFAIVDRDSAAEKAGSELVRASLETGQVTSRVPIDGSGQRVVLARNRIAVLTADGSIQLYAENLDRKMRLALQNANGPGDRSGSEHRNAWVTSDHSSSASPQEAPARFAAAFGSTALVVDADLDRVVETAKTEDAISAICLSSTERLAAFGTVTGDIRIWSFDEDTRLDTKIALPGRIYSVEFSPDNRTLLIAAADAARLVDVSTGDLVGRPISHENDVFDAMFSRNGKFIYTLGDNGVVSASAASDGSMVRHFRTVTGDRSLRPAERRLWLSRSPNGARLLVCGLAPVAMAHDITVFEQPARTVDTKRQRALYELVSSQRVVDGKLLPITTKEWLERWDAYSRKYGLPQLDSIQSSALRGNYVESKAEER